MEASFEKHPIRRYNCNTLYSKSPISIATKDNLEVMKALVSTIESQSTKQVIRPKVEGEPPKIAREKSQSKRDQYYTAINYLCQIASRKCFAAQVPLRAYRVAHPTPPPQGTPTKSKSIGRLANLANQPPPPLPVHPPSPTGHRVTRLRHCKEATIQDGVPENSQALRGELSWSSPTQNVITIFTDCRSAKKRGSHRRFHNCKL